MFTYTTVHVLCRHKDMLLRGRLGSYTMPTHSLSLSSLQDLRSSPTVDPQIYIQGKEAGVPRASLVRGPFLALRAFTRLHATCNAIHTQRRMTQQLMVHLEMSLTAVSARCIGLPIMTRIATQFSDPLLMQS